jgi:hypothetical protein
MRENYISKKMVHNNFVVLNEIYRRLKLVYLFLRHITYVIIYMLSKQSR